MRETFALFVYDSSANRHVVYFVQPSLVLPYVAFGTVPLNEVNIVSMRSVLGFDPAIDRKLKIATVTSRDVPMRPELANVDANSMEAENKTGRILTLHYEPKASQVRETVAMQQWIVPN